MEHVVFFPAHDGSPAFRRVAGLEDAVRLIEHLRNVEGVTEVSVHALTEVPLSFKAWYRVEVPAGAEPLPVAEAGPDVQPAPQPQDEVGAQVEAQVGTQVEAPLQAVPDQPVPAVAVGGPATLGFFA